MARATYRRGIPQFSSLSLVTKWDSLRLANPTLGINSGWCTQVTVMLPRASTVHPGDGGCRFNDIMGQTSRSPFLMHQRFELSLFICDYSDMLLALPIRGRQSNHRVEVGDPRDKNHVDAQMVGAVDGGA